MTTAPCRGCPCSCQDCIFDINGHIASPEETVASKEEYGCVRPDGGALVRSQGRLGMMRGDAFHPVTSAGAAFLLATDNPLATRL